MSVAVRTPSEEQSRSSVSAGTLAAGDVVAEHYRIDAVLGEGGMGVVYRVEHLHLRKLHALKVLLSEWSSAPEVVERFEREAIAAGNIQSPHVAAASDFGRLPDGTFYLVMEYVAGRTLRSALEEGPLGPARALHVLQGIASGLHAAHALGIVHRDLKPENIMLVERDGDPDFVKILDFGVAKVHGVGVGEGSAASTKALTRAGTVIGTPEYMSPEQAMGQPVDARSDLYSAGVILFEMLAGKRPFEGGAVTVLRQHVLSDVPELPEAVRAAIDPPLGSLLRRLLAKTPDNRLGSTAELIEALDACVQPRVVVSPPRLAPAAPVEKRAARARWIGILEVWLGRASHRQLALALALVTIVLAGVVLLLVRSGSRPSAIEVAPTDSAAPAVLPAATAASASSPDSDESPPVASLPPPPPPGASSPPAGTGSAPARNQGRRTGPGGIYIPPPSQWFR
jgi:serine/threonine-protein kinase